VQWTFSVTSASTSLISSPHTILIKDPQGNNIGQITMGILSNASNTFKISVTDTSGNTIFTASKAVNNINDIASFLNNTYIKLPDGVNIKLSPQKSPDGSYIMPVLNSGDSFSVNLTNMLQQSITNIQNSLSQVDANRSVIGAYEQRMQLAQTRINNTSLSNSQTLSNLQDANYAQVISNYEQEITIMQALLQSFAKVNQLSLFNYI
jgi:flagellar hook-associated protein 3 FlgL